MTASVLIVDDSLTVRMDLVDAFVAAGFRALPCATASEARATLRHESVSIAILDVVLPDGDGVELVTEIRNNAALAAMPILMLSTEAEIRDRIRGLKKGADDYVGKPYDTSYVVARARDLLREQSPADSSGKPTLLIIDDSVTFREGLRDALAGAGYAVLTASDGEEGLRVAAAARPTAIVVDGFMPGIDGATVIRKVRLDVALRTTPCVLLTGSEDRGAEPRALDAGADAFVRKEEEFEVILARLSAVIRSASAVPRDTATLMGPKRILAVDDSATYLEQLAAELRAEEYDVVLARSGEEALEMLAVQGVDCILLDLVMPGIGGKETCRRIKASPIVRDIPLIMVTAVEDRDAMIEGLSLGADDYISKSGRFEVLKARVRAQIRRKQFEDEHRRIREELLRSELVATEERAARQVAEAQAALAEVLQRKNQELEAFSYSVSHDLKAPLRGIDGFSQAILEDHASELSETGQSYLRRVRAAAQRMGELIDDLLELSRVGRAELIRGSVDVSAMARNIADDLARRDPARGVEIAVTPGVVADADRRLLTIVLENLMGNAWKFTAKTAAARIEVGAEVQPEGSAFFVRDNGAGFDMQYAQKLFAPFQRLHREVDFPGTGIGLATVSRIVERHGGRVWAKGEAGVGATVWFTLPVGAEER